MSEYDLSQEDMMRILTEEVQAFVDFSSEQLKAICEKGPPIPGRKNDPPSRLQGYIHDTLKTEMMNIFDPDYLAKVREGFLPPPQEYVFYVVDQGQPIAGPYPTPEEAVMNAQAMGVQPDPMTMLPPIIQKQSFWAKLMLLPKEGDWTAFGYFANDFKNLWEMLGRRLEQQVML